MDTTQELYDIYELWHVPFWKTDWFFWVIIVSVLSLIVLLFIVCLRIIRRDTGVISYWQKALIDVDALALKRDTLSNKYSQLLSLVKQYVSQHYGYDIAAKTDAELLKNIEMNNFNAETTIILQKLLANAAEIKFAHASLSQEQFDEAITMTITFIQHTIKKN